MGVLLLIRHGRTSANADGILAGRMPRVFLDEVGSRTAAELGQRLADVPLTKIISSPLERTLETAAAIIAKRKDGTLQIEQEPRLIECDYGSWQGRLLKELAEEPEWKTVQERPDEMVFPQGESMLAMHQRAIAAIREWDAKISAEHGDASIWAAVSHGDVIKAICADALGVPLRKFQRIMIEPASVSVIHYSSTGAAVAKLNDSGDSWIASLVDAPEKPTLGGQSGKGQS